MFISMVMQKNIKSCCGMKELQQPEKYNKNLRFLFFLFNFSGRCDYAKYIMQNCDSQFSNVGNSHGIFNKTNHLIICSQFSIFFT